MLPIFSVFILLSLRERANSNFIYSMIAILTSSNYANIDVIICDPTDLISRHIYYFNHQWKSNLILPRIIPRCCDQTQIENHNNSQAQQHVQHRTHLFERINVRSLSYCYLLLTELFLHRFTFILSYHRAADWFFVERIERVER